MAAVDNIFLTGKIALLSLARTDGINGTGVLPVASATITNKIDTPDASSFASAGYVTLVAGINDVEISVEIMYDKNALPPIFAGMKADVELAPTGGRGVFVASLPTSTEATLASNEYKAYAGTPLVFTFLNCTVSNVTYDVPVRDIQKVKITLIPSAAAEVNWSEVAY